MARNYICFKRARYVWRQIIKNLYYTWESEMFCSNCDDETFKKRMARVARADMCYDCELDGEIPQFDY